ncbi:MAG: hypothetical protein PVF07_08850 [Thiogranum sp.]|jgi:hypothetical protein
MKYYSMIFASTFALSGLAVANQDNSANSQQQADDKVECIETAIADELDGEQKDIFVQECMQQKMAKRAKVNDKNS